METSLQRAFKDAQDRDNRFLITNIYKYLNFSNKYAIEELKKIDIIRNRFKDSTLIAYLGGMRSHLNGDLNARRKHHVSPYVLQIADDLKAKHYAHLTPPKGKEYKKKGSKVEQVINGINTPITVNAEPKQVIVSEHTDDHLLSLKSNLDVIINEEETKLERMKAEIAEKKKKSEAISIVLDMLNNK